MRFWAAVSTVEARRIVELRKPAEILVFSDLPKLAEKKIGANSPDRLEPGTFQERLAFHIAGNGETPQLAVRLKPISETYFLAEQVTGDI